MMHRVVVTATLALAWNTIGPALGAPGLTEYPRWSGSQLEGTGSPPLPLEAVPAYPKIPFVQTVDLDPWPMQAVPRLVALDITGRAWLFDDDAEADERHLLLEIPDAGPEGKRGGGHPQAYSLVFDPGFPERPFVYLCSNRPEGNWGRNRVSRFTVTDPLGEQARCDPESELAVIEWPSKGHNGCDLKFGADGMLYISTGDGDAPGDPKNVGQLTDNLLGSILRIDVNHSSVEKAYVIPADNPFVDHSGIRPEVWAYGLRNPWKMTFAPDGETIFLGDNGDETWEMVRRVTAATNHGWSAYEGSYPFRLSNPLGGPVTELTVPAFEHPHSEMRSVIGGLFYQSEALPELRGTYIYGCYFTGKVWALDWNAADDTLSNPRRIADTRGQLVAFSVNHAGEPLVVTLDGPVLRLREPESMTKAKAIPATLSSTGLFASTEDHRPARGVLPYGINASAWFDGAEKTRWMAVPKAGNRGEVDAPIGERLHKSWRFPNGSAFVQTLWYPGEAGASDTQQRIETQVAHKEGGEWRFLTYRWREDQSDADLVDENGVDAEIKVGDRTLPWRFASRGECSACHTQRSFFVNAVSTEQLMRDFDYSEVGGKPGDQLETLIEIGLFIKNREPARPNAKPPSKALTNPHDPAASPDARARSYLHVNCAHCHRESGLGGRAPFQLLHWLPLDQMGAIDAVPMVGLPGVADARVIAPGAPERSEILRRMQTTETGHMPLIGSRQLDDKGIDLIRLWIEQLAKTSTQDKP